MWLNVWNKKNRPNCFKSCQKLAAAIFTKKVYIFNIVQNVTDYLGYFLKAPWCQEISKIAQSGHFDRERHEILAQEII